MKVRVALALAVAVSGCKQAAANSANDDAPKVKIVEEASDVSSSIQQVRIVRTRRLPPIPKRATVDEYCSSYAITKPKTLDN